MFIVTRVLGMVRAKNYETVSTSAVEVMQSKLWPLFSGHGVHTDRHHYSVQQHRALHCTTVRGIRHQ